MIGKLTGTLDSAGEDSALIDVGGVGYVVFCSRRTLERLGSRGEPASLLVETHVREDHIHLFGFFDQAERDWFGLLSTVQGVGARMALAVLSVLSPADLIQAIAAQDKAALTRASGKLNCGLTWQRPPWSPPSLPGNQTPVNWFHASPAKIPNYECHRSIPGRR